MLMSIYPQRPVAYHEGQFIFKQAVHMDCFDVFIIILVTVIFSCSSSS